jgi:hypothetical protein
LYAIVLPFFRFHDFALPRSHVHDRPLITDRRTRRR